MFVRRLVQIYYKRKGDAEGTLTAFPCKRSGRVHLATHFTSLYRTDPPFAAQNAARKTRRVQEEDQLQRDAISARKVRRLAALHPRLLRIRIQPTWAWTCPWRWKRNVADAGQESWTKRYPAAAAATEAEGYSATDHDEWGWSARDAVACSSYG